MKGGGITVLHPSPPPDGKFSLGFHKKKEGGHLCVSPPTSFFSLRPCPQPLVTSCSVWVGAAAFMYSRPGKSWMVCTFLTVLLVGWVSKFMIHKPKKQDRCDGHGREISYTLIKSILWSNWAYYYHLFQNNGKSLLINTITRILETWAQLHHSLTPSLPFSNKDLLRHAWMRPQKEMQHRQNIGINEHVQ